MSDDRNDPGPDLPTAEKSDIALVRLWHRVVEGLAALGTVMIGVLGLIICADIVARNSMGASLPLVSELGALIVVMIVALQLAAAVRADRLARTEVFFEGLKESRPKVGRILGVVFNIVGAVILTLIAKSSVGILMDDWESAEFIGVVGMATLPTWPIRALIMIGFGVAAIEFAIRALLDLRAVARARS